MIQSLVLGALVGGVVVFIWGAISWMALPWHHRCFNEFKDEDAAVRAMTEHAPVSGLYGYPGEPRYPDGATKEQREKADQAAWDKMKSGPLVFAVINRNGFGSFPKYLAGGFAIGVIAALILTAMLLQTSGLSYWGRALFVGGGGLAAGVICRLPDWNWHGFPAGYTAVGVADATIGWLLAGLAIAAVVKPA